MARRKVAYLTPLYFDEGSCIGGGERYPMNLARGVVAASGGRYEVELISFGRRADRRPLGPGLTLRVLPAAATPVHPLDVVSWDLPAALADADLVHVHQVFSRCGEMGVLVARQQRTPVCVTDHGGESSPLGREVGILDLADRIVAYSDFGASFYARTRTPIVVIKGGVDGRFFRPPADRPARDRMVFVGRLLPHKGVDTLIKGMPHDLRLTLCGRPHDAHYYEYLKSLAWFKTVEFVHDADDATVRDLYARAWASILPSVYKDTYGETHAVPELMGFALLEALACGTPAVCSRVGAMPEFVAEGETGFSYEYDDVNALTRLIRLLAGDPALVERLGRNGRRAVEREFDLEVAGAKLVAVYDERIAAAREAAA